MSAVAMSGNDTINISGYVFTAEADETTVDITFDSEIAAVKVGKNGNSIYALNQTGKVAQVVIRTIRGAADDLYLNNLLLQQQSNFAGFVLMNGTFVKKIGDGQGNITSDTYVMGGGIFSKMVGAKSNSSGDTEQSVAIYTLKFSNAPRSLS